MSLEGWRAVEFRLLGELEVLRDGRPLAVRGKARIVIALLLLQPNRPVGVDRIIEALWGGEAPATARQTVQYYVHRIRRLLAGSGTPAGGGVLVTEGDAYLLRVEPEQLDTERFQRLTEQARQARAAGDLAGAADAYRRALALWRGPALAEFAEDAFAQPERARLESRRLQAIEDRAEVLLELGRQLEVAEELAPLVRVHPWRERLRALHVLALYRSGRQSEALAAYRATRARFVEELGIEPGAELQRLERGILAHDPALNSPAPAPAPLTPTPAPAAASAPAAVPSPGPLAASPGSPPSNSLPSVGAASASAGAAAASVGVAAASAQVAAPTATRAARAGRPAAGGARADPLAAPPAWPPGGEERKVVTALVAELVDVAPQRGDTEDHVARHARVMQRIHQEVGRYGGIVHTVLGRTLLAVFGATRVREDDPERAVRAAMAIAEVADPAGLAVRVGVETGAALVAPAALEPAPSGLTGGPLVTGITGAALDAASVLGVSATPGSVLVGPAAHRATARQIDYQPARGGAWRPLAPLAVIGSAVALPGDPTVPLVERDLELTLLMRTLARVRQDLEPQLVTLIGAPGIGKSRLVAEFGKLVDADPELITWRQARSVPYGAGGEGVTLWALAEIVRAQAGIMEADPAEVVDAKLAHAVAGVIPDEHERAQVEQRLRPLVRTVTGPAGTTDQRRQLVDGWARFVSALADDRPVVIVVEDIHWADQELLDCLDGLLDQVGPVPLLMVCTARPELLEQRPGWGGGKRNSATVTLAPLSERGSVAMLDALLADLGGAAALPEPALARLLTHAGGIPLYLEEYVRILRDQAGGPAGLARLGEDLPLPETAQQIVSARLDALPLDEKTLLQNMAVLGEIGWRDPLAALTGMPPDAVDEALQRLAQHELVSPTRESARGGRREYVFRHALLRDVAYGQLLRAERADKHRRVAEWLAATRGGERAEQVAYHYQQALELTSAAGWSIRPLAGAARLAFRNAGDRAAALGALGAAVRYYEQALELWPHDAPDRAELLLQLGRARAYASSSGETELLAAKDAFEAAGDAGRAAEASVTLAFIARVRGAMAASRAYNDHALRLAGSGPPSRTTATVLNSIARDEMVADRNEEAIRIGRQAMRMAADVGMEEVVATARATVGAARIKTGDLGGLTDMAEGIAVLQARHDQIAALYCFTRVRALWRYGDLAGVAEALAVSRRAADEFGAQSYHRWMDVIDALLAHAAGRWDDALQIIEGWLDHSSRLGLFLPWCLTARGAIRLDRGDVDGALADAAAMLENLPPEPRPEAIQPALALRGRALLTIGRVEEARTELRKLLADIAAHSSRSLATTDTAVLVAELGDPAGGLPGGLIPTRWHHAVRAFAAGDFARAAALYGQIGALPDQALAWLYHARQLAGQGRGEEAAAVLVPAVTFWKRVGAAARLADAEALRAG